MKLQQLRGKVENVAVTRPPCKLIFVLQSPCSRLERPAEAGPTSPAGA